MFQARACFGDAISDNEQSSGARQDLLDWGVDGVTNSVSICQDRGCPAVRTQSLQCFAYGKVAHILLPPVETLGKAILPESCFEAPWGSHPTAETALQICYFAEGRFNLQCYVLLGLY